MNETINNNHGGKRPNAGRRPTGEQPRTIKRTVTLTAAEDQFIRESQHGIGTLWRLLQSSKEFRAWKNNQPGLDD